MGNITQSTSAKAALLWVGTCEDEVCEDFDLTPYVLGGVNEGIIGLIYQVGSNNAGSIWKGNQPSTLNNLNAADFNDPIGNKLLCGSNYYIQLAPASAGQEEVLNVPGAMFVYADEPGKGRIFDKNSTKPQFLGDISNLPSCITKGDFQNLITDADAGVTYPTAQTITPDKDGVFIQTDGTVHRFFTGKPFEIPAGSKLLKGNFGILDTDGDGIPDAHDSSPTTSDREPGPYNILAVIESNSNGRHEHMSSTNNFGNGFSTGPFTGSHTVSLSIYKELAGHLPGNGFIFDKWVVTSGGGIISQEEDPDQATLTVSDESNTTVSPTFKQAPAQGTTAAYTGGSHDVINQTVTVNPETELGGLGAGITRTTNGTTGPISKDLSGLPGVISEPSFGVKSASAIMVNDTNGTVYPVTSQYGTLTLDGVALIPSGWSLFVRLTSVVTNSDFNTAVNLWFDDQSACIDTYGHISDWNVSQVTDMSEAFLTTSNSTRDKSSFNEDIGGWDVSNVTDMWRMFFGATAFNQDIGDWNTGSVTNMHSMFSYAEAFNPVGSSVTQPIGDWDTSNVTIMSAMFRSATAFNQDISDWDTGNVAQMSGMFFGADSFNQNISTWNVSSATDMDLMFYDTDALSNTNKGNIHESFSSNSNWDTDWSSFISTVTDASISADGRSLIFVKSNGSLWGAGRNQMGQLGLGDNTSRTAIELIRGPGVAGGDVISIASGNNHHMFATSNGDVFTMGYNNYGQLGNSNPPPGNIPNWFNIYNKNTPTYVANGITSSSGLGAGEETSYFLHDNGDLFHTGKNGGHGSVGGYGGMYGNGEWTHLSNLSSNSSGEIPLASRPIIKVVAGESHALLLTSDGAVYASGLNDKGQLGTGDTVDKYTWTLITTGFDNAVDISASGKFSLILTSGGELIGVGENGNGQLGGTTTSYLSWRSLASSNVVSIASAPHHSLWAKSDGTVWFMGDPFGNPSYSTHWPAQILGMSDVLKVFAGENNSLFLKSDGRLWGIGTNPDGALNSGVGSNFLPNPVNAPAQVA